jgi:hypothetical protein
MIEPVAVDLLHGQPREAVAIDPTVDQSYQTGMAETGKQRALRCKMLRGLQPVQQRGVEDAFDRYPLRELTIIAVGAIDLAHPTVTEQLANDEAADPSAGQQGSGDWQSAHSSAGGVRCQATQVKGLEQPDDDSGKRRVCALQLRNPRAARIGGGIEQGVQFCICAAHLFAVGSTQREGG